MLMCSRRAVAIGMPAKTTSPIRISVVSNPPQSGFAKK
jgi:hypothetical protein